MLNIFKSFSSCLENRIINGIHTTEDSVRYTFFYSLIQNKLQPEDLVLEYPHPNISGAEIDTWIPSYSGNAYAIEFKYHRKLNSKKNRPRTEQAGGTFSDVRRLSLITTGNLRCVFIYFTDVEMQGYFRNPSNGVSSFFDLEVGSYFDINQSFLGARAKSFQRAAGGNFSARVKCLLSDDLHDQHSLRIYEVL